MASTASGDNRPVMHRISEKIQSSVEQLCSSPTVLQVTQKISECLQDGVLELVLLLVLMNYAFFHTSTDVGLISYICLGMYAIIRLQLSVDRHPDDLRFQLIGKVYVELLKLLTTTLCIFLISGVGFKYVFDQKTCYEILAKMASSVDYVAFHVAVGSALARFLKHDFTIHRFSILQYQAILLIAYLPLAFFNSTSLWAGQVMCTLAFKSFLAQVIILTQNVFGSGNEDEPYYWELQPGDSDAVVSQVTLGLFVSILAMFFGVFFTV